MPDTDSVSSVIADISAFDSCAWRATTCRVRPPRRVITANSGTRHSDSSVSCQEMASIATTVLITMTTLAMIDDAVDVTTVCTPPTSLASPWGAVIGRAGPWHSNERVRGGE